MHRFFLSFSKVMALLGGLVLTILILLIVTSILGRTLNSLLHSGFAQMILGGSAQSLIDMGLGPVNGDYELVEAGIAFSILHFFL